MTNRLPLLLILLLLITGCAARSTDPVPVPTQPAPLVTRTVPPTAAATLAPTSTPPQPTATAPSLAELLPTATEISPLALTLIAPTVTPGVPPAALSPEPETPPAYTRLFHDPFDDNSKGWALSEGMEIKEGALRMWTGKRDINAVVAPLAAHTQTDVSVQLDAQVVQWDGKSSLMFGVGCRMDEASYDQYMMFVGPLGGNKAMLQMVKFKGGSLVQLTELPQLFDLPDDITQKPVPFEFICRGKTLAFKAGAKTIATIEDAEYTSGSIDLFVMGKDKQAVVAFDNVEVGGSVDR